MASLPSNVTKKTDKGRGVMFKMANILDIVDGNYVSFSQHRFKKFKFQLNIEWIYLSIFVVFSPALDFITLLALSEMKHIQRQKGKKEKNLRNC